MANTTSSTRIAYAYLAQKGGSPLSLQPDYGTSDAALSHEAADKVAKDPPLWNAAEADEALGKAYRSLVDLKMGFDSWEEIPKSAMPLYKEIMKAMNAVGEARKPTYQVRLMVQRKKYGSTNTERYFYNATDGKWYVDNESYEEDWDTGEQIEGDMTTYGPFTSFRAAERWIDQNFANSGAYTKDDSGRERPPRRPVKPGGRRWASEPPRMEIHGRRVRVNDSFAQRLKRGRRDFILEDSPRGGFTFVAPESDGTSRWDFYFRRDKEPGWFLVGYTPGFLSILQKIGDRLGAGTTRLALQP